MFRHRHFGSGSMKCCSGGCAEQNSSLPISIRPSTRPPVFRTLTPAQVPRKDTVRENSKLGGHFKTDSAQMDRWENTAMYDDLRSRAPVNMTTTYEIIARDLRMCMSLRLLTRVRLFYHNTFARNKGLYEGTLLAAWFPREVVKLTQNPRAIPT